MTVMASVRAIVFDVGETLVDETRAWSERAIAAGLTPFTLMAALGATIERGADHREVWPMLGIERPSPPTIDAVDLYPDALPALRSLRAAGYTIGIAGNQPDGAVEQLQRAGVEADLIASSTTWQVEKPSSQFFQRIEDELGLAGPQILYVGDRLDNDVLPASERGMRTVLVRRGPWGYLHARRPEAHRADLVCETLTELVEQLLGR